jgi:hypothetical protein
MADGQEVLAYIGAVVVALSAVFGAAVAIVLFIEGLGRLKIRDKKPDHER